MGIAVKGSGKYTILNLHTVEILTFPTKSSFLFDTIRISNRQIRHWAAIWIPASVGVGRRTVTFDGFHKNSEYDMWIDKFVIWTGWKTFLVDLRYLGNYNLHRNKRCFYNFKFWDKLHDGHRFHIHLYGNLLTLIFYILTWWLGIWCILLSYVNHFSHTEET